MKHRVNQKQSRWIWIGAIGLFLIVGNLCSLNKAYGIVNIDVMGIYVPVKASSQSMNELVSLNDGFGINAGLSIDILRLGYVAFWQMRLDYNYQTFRDFIAIRNMHTIAIGPRILFGGELPVWLVPYLEIAFQVHFFDGFIFNYEPTRFAAFTGFGVEFFIFEGLYLTSHLRYHIGERMFLSIAAGFGYRF